MRGVIIISLPKYSAAHKVSLVKRSLFLISIFIALFFTANGQQANTTRKVKIIELKDGAFKFTPRDFHISRVIDDRDDITNIGFAKIGLSDRQTPLQLFEGAATSIQELLDYNMKQNTKTTPVELHIIALDVSEKRSNGIDKAEIELGFAFYVQGHKAIELTSEGYVKSGTDATAHIESLIRKQTESAIKQFATWFEKNKEELTSAPSIKVEVTVNNTPIDKDYIPYSFDRQLTYSDFRGKPDELSIAAAGTATTVSLDASSLTLRQEVLLKIKVGALFNREMSWFKKEAMHRKVLAHEQVHFDITTCMACDLIHALRNYRFTPGNYEEELQQLKKKSERDTQQMQNSYDEETNHGLIEDKQSEWRNKVTELLLLQDCFK